MTVFIDKCLVFGACKTKPKLHLNAIFSFLKRFPVLPHPGTVTPETQTQLTSRYS